MYSKRAFLLTAFLLLTLSFCLSQLIVIRKYTSISVAVHFNNSLNITSVDVETTYSYTSEKTVYAFNYSEITISLTVPKTPTEYEYESFIVMLNNTSLNYWFSIPLKIQSEGYVQHVFFNVQYGTYTVTARILHEQLLTFDVMAAYWEIVPEGGSMLTRTILDEQKLEFAV